MIESIAKTMLCPMSHDVENCCEGEICMAWRWEAPPELNKAITMTIKRVCQVAGIDFSSVVDEKKLMEEAIRDPLVLKIIEGPREGWHLSEKASFCEEDFLLVSTYSRMSDPNASGYCGMVGKP